VFLRLRHQRRPGERGQQRPECDERHQSLGHFKKAAFQVGGGHRQHSRRHRPEGLDPLIVVDDRVHVPVQIFNPQVSTPRLAVRIGAKPLHARMRWMHQRMVGVTVRTRTLILWYDRVPISARLLRLNANQQCR